ncbi:hypothetical protein [Vibrio furnissii]|uniref:hypothetical protein n=1 Tax=Vibrio furnissii TaxID=29494 RepID=UPI003752FDA8
MDYRKSLKRKIFKNKLCIDESLKELSVVTQKYEYCFAGVSSIFLEASISKMKCFSVSEIYNDYYKFENDGIVKVFYDWSLIDFESIQYTDHISKFLYDSCESYLEYIKKPSDRIRYILEFEGIL